MNASESVKRPLGLFIVVVIMAVGVFVVGERLRTGGADPHGDHDAVHGVLDTVRNDQGIMQVPESAIAMDHQVEAGVGLRRLSAYYALRHYPGAPPKIPHEVSADMDRAMDCNVCHQKGGFVPKYNTYAPITPHPEYDNCMQCHVPGRTAEVFVETQFEPVAAPGLKRPALPGGPIPIPHTLQLRQNCLACHGGPAAPPEIRTSHPERTHCMQCHVPSNEGQVFKRSPVAAVGEGD